VQLDRVARGGRRHGLVPASEGTRLGGWPGLPIVCTENSDSDVLVVQPTDKRMRRNASGPLNRSGYRGIFVQGTMGPRLIVIASV
jgi:hypothetical protein